MRAKANSIYGSGDAEGSTDRHFSRGGQVLTDSTFPPGGHRLTSSKAAPGLHLVATPIGNLGDITLRALETLAAVDIIACEDTRITRRLTERYGIAADLTPYHEHNAATARPKLLERLGRG